ncbi:MAG TPA: hypothetical protein VFH31_20170 [Pyrinomonadaceae bacterium]|nr:hypothetical protein [Pyrinomonadaceae bacterium]
MALAIFDAITIHISRVLEALLDELEYRMANRALRRATKLKARRRSRPTVLPNEEVATSSKTIPVRAT